MRVFLVRRPISDIVEQYGVHAFVCVANSATEARSLHPLGVDVPKGVAWTLNVDQLEVTEIAAEASPECLSLITKRAFPRRSGAAVLLYDTEVA